MLQSFKAMTSPISRRAAWIAAALAAVIGATAPTDARADHHEHHHAPSYAVRAGTLIVADPAGRFAINDGVLIIRNGQVDAYGGPDTEIPDDLAVLDLSGQTVMPGLVAAATGLAGEHAASEAVSGLFRGVDAFNEYSDLRRWLATGVTAVHLNPGEHRLASGVGGVVKLGGPARSRIIADETDLQVSFLAAARNAPEILRLLIPPAADGMIQPPLRQSPQSRLDMRQALDGYLELGRAGVRADGEIDPHLKSFAAKWDANTPIRISADRAEEIRTALELARTESRRKTTIVGAAEIGEFIGSIGAMRLPVVYKFDAPLPRIAGDPRFNANPLERSLDAVAALARDDRIVFALAPADGDPANLRLAAIRAARSEASPERLVRAITSNAAAVLGVADRIGSLARGRDADFVVLGGDPLDPAASIRRAYIDGRLVFQQPASDSLILRAGTIWIDTNETIADGAVLVEDGVITAVGRTVPSSPGARIIDLGDDAFVTPGFIDARGHLAYGNSNFAPQPEFEIERTIGAADLDALSLADAGVTTVITAPRRINGNGSRFAAIKTAGMDRASRVVAPTAAVAFDVRGTRPSDIPRRLKARIEGGKKYHEKWVKYAEELEQWKEAKRTGDTFEVSEDEGDDEPTEAAPDDPVTGVWMMTVSSAVIPEPVAGRVALTMTGNQVEGRVIEPEAAEVEHRIVGTFADGVITGTIEIDTGGVGTPAFTLNVPGDETATGSIEIGEVGISINVEGNRVDKAAPSFKVVRKRSTTGRDGRPLPPAIDEGLEPWRAVFEGNAVVAVFANSPAETTAALDFIKPFEIPVTLIAPPDADRLSDRLTSESIPVVAALPLVQTDFDRGGAFGFYTPALDLMNEGVHVAFQSGAGTGARELPNLGLAAVAAGFAPDQVLAALTTNAARAYRLHDRIGHINAGAHADLLVFDGHPFESGSTLRHVFVGGKEIAP